MKKSTAKLMLLNELEPFFVQEGYSKVKSRICGFVKPNLNGLDRFYLDIYDYGSTHQAHYYLFKKNDVVEEIYKLLHNHFVIHPALSEISSTVSFTYESINSLNQTGYLPEIMEENDIGTNVSLIIDFLRQTGFPLLTMFDNLKEIDMLINNDEYWKDDWRKPFQLSGFAYKRLIIAYLCGNTRYEQLLNYHNSLFDYNDDKFIVQIIDGKNSIEYLDSILSKSGKWNIA